jgi:hypothetical protein
LITLIIDARPPCRRPGSLEKRPVTFLRDVARPRVAKPMGLSRQTLLQGTPRTNLLFTMSRQRANVPAGARCEFLFCGRLLNLRRRSTDRPPNEGWWSRTGSNCWQGRRESAWPRLHPRA